MNCTRQSKIRFGNKRGGVFFEAGANDGLYFSNTAYLEFYCGWTGLLVEAVPHKFVECVRNRPHSIVSHCALVPPEYADAYVELHYSNVMSFAPTLAEINQPTHIASAQASSYLWGWEQKLSMQIFFAPAKTLDDVLIEHDLKHIDLMVIDLEGAELPALRGMDFRRCRVDAIIVETRNVEEMDTLLTGQGFRRCAQLAHIDYLYLGA